MFSLPVELCYSISLYLNHRDYLRLRCSSKFFSKLDPVQYLNFKSYQESVDILSELLYGTVRIKLDSQSFNNDSFIYIALEGHVKEFVRLLRTPASKRISVYAKEFAFIVIIEMGHPHEMIIELLKEGSVNASIPVSFDIPHSLNHIEEGTALHWACAYGFLEIVQLLLKDKKVDVCAKDLCDIQPVHLAADLNQFEIIKLLRNDERVDFHAETEDGWVYLFLI
jgi:hypothetical protein